MTNLSTQIKISIFSALIFFVVNLLRTKQDGDKYFCAERTKILLLTLIFCAISFLSMYKSNIDVKTKLRHSIYGALIFYIISSPAMNIFINMTLGDEYSSGQGCPTIRGLLLNAMMYCLFLIFMMRL